MELELTTSLLRRAYRSGIFPMAHPEAGDVIQWYAPRERGVLPLDDFHVPSNLGKLVRRRTFEVTTDRAFERVMRACADRKSTWISDDIIEVYIRLHHEGDAHSVECWQDGTLAGGLYGVALGGAFFGESMFFRVSNASKVALVHLVRQLRHGGFALLDTQYVTDHLRQFGAFEIDREDYHELLQHALRCDTTWWPLEDAAEKRRNGEAEREGFGRDGETGRGGMAERERGRKKGT